MKHHHLILILFLVSYNGMAFHPYSLKLHFKNQTQYNIVLQSITGDRFTDLDTLKKDGTYHFCEGLTVGMYRLLIGRAYDSTDSDEPDKAIDFIFNNEDIEFSTDLDAPTDSLVVIGSEENKVWAGFNRKEIEYRKSIKELEIEIEFFRKHGIIDPAAKTEFNNKTKKYNQLQIVRNELIDQISKQHPGLFASKLIAYYREPILDGVLPKEERKSILKRDFFNGIEFNDETVINSPVYTDRVYKYLSNHYQMGLSPEQQESEYIKAKDQILARCRQNEKVYGFVLNYLFRYFKRFNFEKLNLQQNTK